MGFNEFLLSQKDEHLDLLRRQTTDMAVTFFQQRNRKCNWKVTVIYSFFLTYQLQLPWKVLNFSKLIKYFQLHEQIVIDCNRLQLHDYDYLMSGYYFNKMFKLTNKSSGILFFCNSNLNATEMYFSRTTLKLLRVSTVPESNILVMRLQQIVQ